MSESRPSFMSSMYRSSKTAERHPYNVIEIGCFLWVKGWVYSYSTVWYITWQQQRKL